MRRSFRIATAALLTVIPLFADGGAVLLHKSAGQFVVTVFGTPQVGTSDLSVFVQNAQDRNPVLDAEVTLRLGGASVRATHEAATNKLLYAANVELSHAGRTHLEVTIERAGERVVIEGDLDVMPASPPILAYWPYFALVPTAILLFALNQRLKNKRRVSRLAVRP